MGSGYSGQVCSKSGFQLHWENGAGEAEGEGHACGRVVSRVVTD